PDFGNLLPNTPIDWKQMGTYGYNRCYTGLGLGTVAFDSSNLVNLAVSESQVIAPSEMLAMGDSRVIANKEGSDWENFQFGDWGSNEVGPRGRHAKGSNVVHCDLHVALVNHDDLYYPTSLHSSASNWNYDHQPHPEWWP